MEGTRTRITKTAITESRSRSPLWLFHFAQPASKVMPCEMIITAGACTGGPVSSSTFADHTKIDMNILKVGPSQNFFNLLTEQLLTVSITGTWFN